MKPPSRAVPVAVTVPAGPAAPASWAAVTAAVAASESRDASTPQIGSSGPRDSRLVTAYRPTPEVLRVLLDNHSRFLAFLERRVGSRDEAEDILQEAFVRSLERAPPMEDSTSAITWFYRVLRNALTDYYRRRDSRVRAIDRLAAETESVTEPDKELEALVCTCVMSLLDTLKPEYEMALRRVELEGVSVRSYAEEAGI